jgi:hypothetical protein
MHRARSFFYVAAGVFLLALSYHLGARTAGAQASQQSKDAMARIDSLKARHAALEAARIDSLRAVRQYLAALDTLDALDELGRTLAYTGTMTGNTRRVPQSLSLQAIGTYSKAAVDPALSTLLLEDVLADYVLAKGGARSAPQITQIADEALVRLGFLQAAQSRQQLILLRQIASRK